MSLARLPGGEEEIMQPVAEGFCRYESLLDGTLLLRDIDLMNDAISVRNENDRRLSKRP